MVAKRSVVIIDDHPLFREGLKVIIARNPRYQVVGEAGSAREGLQIVGRLRPNLVTVDISLGDQSGIELTKEIKRLSPSTGVLIISMHSKVDYIAEAFRAGATGYVVKESASERLLHGLDYVSEGRYFLDSSVSYQVVEKLIAEAPKEGKVTDKAYSSLTSREQEVLRLLAEGHSAREVAEELRISLKTVENHRFNIMGKLDLHSTHQLVRYAAKIGLIDVDLWKS